MWSLVLALVACYPDEGGASDPVEDSPFAVPLAADSPWPKFRGNEQQSGRISHEMAEGSGEPWAYTTGKGIFSSPVVAGDGTIYVGSADRSFYALHPDGTERWSVETGEIIDSSALLDDEGRVIFGSGDGLLRALDTETGDELWTFEAEHPDSTGAYLNWFEGNVAIGVDGTLVVPNDNFRVYAIDRSTGEQAWELVTNDQTWSLPAVDGETGNLFIGNNVMLEALGANTFAISPDGDEIWSASSNGTVAASPLLTSEGKVVVGGFDGFVRAYDAETGEELWATGARDHIYASPSELPDGTIVQPAADGTVYGLDPADGSVVWAFDTLEPIRSSAAIDDQGRMYMGAGDGQIYVLDPDGTLRWSMQLITDDRDDLNSSPALGRDAVYIAGESGEIFSIPVDWCLTADDSRCTLGPDEVLPSDGAFLYFTDLHGGVLDPAPDEIGAQDALAFSLFVREDDDTVLAHIDSDSVTVDVSPDAEVDVLVSGDRRFLTIEPTTSFGATDVTITISGDYPVGRYP